MTSENYHQWGLQRQREFDGVCASYKLNLSPPVFEISKSIQELGGWQSTTRTIKLSENLICDYSWGVVLQVLKHEMAHQVCSELFAGQAKGHGDHFQRACELLCVLPEFRGHKVLNPKMLEQQSERAAGTGSKVLFKIEKLFALGESANEHEAALAMQKAKQLLEKYHLGELTTSAHSPYYSVIIELQKKQVATYLRHICLILQNFFFVRVVLNRLYNPERDDSFKTIELFGTQDKLAVAEYCFYFLDKQLAVCWQQNRGRFHGSARKMKNSYYLGILNGFYQKLQRQHDAGKEKVHPPGMNELIVAEEKRLNEYVSMLYPELGKSSSRKITLYGDLYKEGVETGKNLSFNNGIQGGGKKPCLLKSR